MSQRDEGLEDLVCLAATAFAMLEGYLGPQWFDAVHDLQLEGPDKVAKAAGIIAAHRSAMTAAEGGAE